MRSDVVLLPGLHGSTTLFASFVALAPPWARCLPQALPAVGDQTFDALAGALEPELRRLEGFVLVAESFSGPIAARLAARLGQKVALLVLCNPLVEIGFELPPGLAAAIVASRAMPAWCAAIALSGGDLMLARAALREVRASPRLDGPQRYLRPTFLRNVKSAVSCIVSRPVRSGAWTATDFIV